MAGGGNLVDVTFFVERAWAERFEDEAERRRLHKERSRLLHSAVEALDIEVRDWGETDARYPREEVELVAALGSAGVFTALVQVFRSWIQRHKIRDVRIRTRAGDEVSVGQASVEDIEHMIRSLRIPKRART
jgi:hypothetical protein